MAIFTGAGVAIITPFNEDDTVNSEELLMIRLLIVQMQLLYVVQQVNHQQCLTKNTFQL